MVRAVHQVGVQQVDVVLVALRRPRARPRDVLATRPRQPAKPIAGRRHARVRVGSARSGMREGIGVNHPLAVAFGGLLESGVRGQGLCADLCAFGVDVFKKVLLKRSGLCHAGYPFWSNVETRPGECGRFARVSDGMARGLETDLDPSWTKA